MKTNHALQYIDIYSVGNSTSKLHIDKNKQTHMWKKQTIESIQA